MLIITSLTIVLVTRRLATTSGSVSASLDLMRSEERDHVVFTVRPLNGYIGDSDRPLRSRRDVTTVALYKDPTCLQ